MNPHHDPTNECCYSREHLPLHPPALFIYSFVPVLFKNVLPCPALPALLLGFAWPQHSPWPFLPRLPNAATPGNTCQYILLLSLSSLSFEFSLKMFPLPCPARPLSGFHFVLSPSFPGLSVVNFSSPANNAIIKSRSNYLPPLWPRDYLLMVLTPLSILKQVFVRRSGRDHSGFAPLSLLARPEESSPPVI